MAIIKDGVMYRATPQYVEQLEEDGERVTCVYQTLKFLPPDGAFDASITGQIKGMFFRGELPVPALPDSMQEAVFRGGRPPTALMVIRANSLPGLGAVRSYVQSQLPVGWRAQQALYEQMEQLRIADIAGAKPWISSSDC